MVRPAAAVIVTMPGLPAAQIGMLLRVKALSQGSGQAFLCSLTNDFQGIHTGISEYFSESQRAMMAFHGPLMIKWYADNPVLGAGEADLCRHGSVARDRNGDHCGARRDGLGRGEGCAHAHTLCGRTRCGPCRYRLLTGRELPSCHLAMVHSRSDRRLR